MPLCIFLEKVVFTGDQAVWPPIIEGMKCGFDQPVQFVWINERQKRLTQAHI
jgi:hypothetical protein